MHESLCAGNAVDFFVAPSAVAAAEAVPVRSVKVQTGRFMKENEGRPPAATVGQLTTSSQ